MMDNQEGRGVANFFYRKYFFDLPAKEDVIFNAT